MHASKESVETKIKSEAKMHASKESVETKIKSETKWSKYFDETYE